MICLGACRFCDSDTQGRQIETGGRQEFAAVGLDPEDKFGVLAFWVSSTIRSS